MWPCDVVCLHGEGGQCRYWPASLPSCPPTTSLSKSLPHHLAQLDFPSECGRGLAIGTDLTVEADGRLMEAHDLACRWRLLCVPLFARREIILGDLLGAFRGPAMGTVLGRSCLEAKSYVYVDPPEAFLCPLSLRSICHSYRVTRPHRLRARAPLPEHQGHNF